MSDAIDEDTDGKRKLLAARLREARDYAGLSQDDVATAMGLSRPAISNIESGQRRVEAVELETLARLYGKPVQQLLTGEAAEETPEVAFLARATQGLSKGDLEELARFAGFLKSSAKNKQRGR